MISSLTRTAEKRLRAMARRLMVLALVASFALGALSLVFQRWGWINADAAVVVVTVGTMILFGGFVWRNARTLQSNEDSWELKDRFETMFRTSPAFIALLEGPDYVFAEANERYLSLVGKNRNILGKSLATALPEIAQQGFIRQLDRARETGEPFVGREIAVTLERRPGFFERRFLDFVDQPVHFKDGQYQQIFVHGFDVTERVLVRTSIENERENFRRLFRQTPELVCILSGPDHVFEFVNDAHIRVLGFDATGMAVREAQPESIEIHGILDDVYNKGTTAELNEIPVTVTDRIRYFNLTYAPRNNDEGKINGIMILGTEVTDQVVARKELEQSKEAAEHAKQSAEMANEAKSNFLANMSHEIRTPLGAILGFSEIARQSDLPRADLNSYLETIERNSNQVLRIIDDILDLAKVEAGKIVFERVKFSLADFLADFSSLMNFRARENGISFEWKADTGLPSHIISDPTRLRQILTNSVGNAIKFTSRGSVKLHIAYKDGFIDFTVTDTGRGISADQISALFRPFAQADASTTRKFGGTGLGLVLTKRFCQQMGGDYTLVRSEIDVGSTFRARVQVELPASVQIVDVTARFSTPAPLKGPAMTNDKLTGTKILLVEDSPDNQMLLEILLKKQGAELEIANDGLEGVDFALKNDYDIVLMDIQMPKMDGHEAVRTLRDRGYKIPVIALTAHAMKEEIDRAQASGFSGYLTKPIQKEALIETISSFTTDGSPL